MHQQKENKNTASTLRKQVSQCLMRKELWLTFEFLVCACVCKYDDVQYVITFFFFLSYFFKEQGEFLALDLGGANFRVLLVKVMADGEQKVEMENQIYDIPEHLMRGSGTEVRGRMHS